MNYLKSPLAILLNLSVLTASTAALAEEESGFTLTPMVGVINYANKTDLAESGTASLAAGYKFASPWAIELAYLASKPEVAMSDLEVDVQQLRLDALYYAGDAGATRPFVVFGAGQNNYDADGYDAEDETIVNAGIGVKHAFNHALALRGDVRGIYGVDENFTDVGLNLGLQWLIGGKKSSSSSAAPAAVAAAAIIDGDNDGVDDSMDSCLDTPYGVQVDVTGCQLGGDDDGDGVFNSVDACPDTAEGARVDEQGCYIMIEEDVTVALQINFANNSDTIASGHDQLQKVADFMREFPVAEVVIEGHTDSSGAASYNQQLSQRRAEAVATELTSAYGIDASRVAAVGYGETRPIASNDTPEGRAENRRVTAVVKATIEKIAE